MEEILIISCWIWGVHSLFRHLIFQEFGDFIERILGTTICKPIFICPPCMSSVHGSISGLFIYGLSFKVILFVIALTGFNYAIKTFIYKEEKSYIDEEE